MGNPNMKISAVVLTRNEEKNIKRCLESVAFCDEIIVVDDYSVDKTIEIIQKSKVKSQKLKSKVKITQRQLKGDFAGQRNFGMSKAENEWILFIDADETISSQLREEIELKINPPAGGEKLKIKETAFNIKRRDFFWGKELKWGEVRKIRQIGLIRLIRKNSGKWLGDVHEEYKISNQESVIGNLKNFLNHYPHQTLKEFIRDINWYSSLRAKELFNQKKKTNIFEIIFFPVFKFIYNYLINLGLLDGPEGFVYAFLMSFHSFLVRTKLYLMKQ